jgi:PAS domain S-box-containing protein
MFALDCENWKVINANLAAEELSGFSHEELIGMWLPDLHPESERKLIRAEIQKASIHSLNLPPGFHLQSKDGHSTPVLISFSKSATMNGRTVVNIVYNDISELVKNAHQLSTQNWALSAYAIAALALGRACSTESLLLQAICDAITQKSVYVLTYVAIAEDGPNRPLRVVASAGSARGYLEGLHLNWAKTDSEGMGPTGICIRTNKVQIVQDSEVDAVFSPWRKRAMQFGIRSIVSIPLCVEGDGVAQLLCLPNILPPLNRRQSRYFSFLPTKFVAAYARSIRSSASLRSVRA